MASEAARHFNDALRNDPAGAREAWLRLREAFTARNIAFGGSLMPTLLRPQFVDGHTWTTLTTGATRLVRLAERAARTAFEGRLEALLDFLGAPEEHRALLRLAPRGPDVSLSRVDAFVGSPGVRFIEINSDAPAGFGYADRMGEVFAEIPWVASMLESRAISTFGSVDALVAELRSHAPVPNPRVAIVDLASVRTRPDQEILREEFLRRGLLTILADPRDLEIVSGRLTAEGEPIDLVYRRVVISDILASKANAKAFLTAYEKGLAVFVNSFRCYLSEDKAFFALLTDDRFASLLTEDECAFVASSLPWTRKLEDVRTTKSGNTIELLPWTIRNREQLVLKPSHGYGGGDVIVGSSVHDSKWSEAIEAAAKTPGWIVQERVEIPEEEFPVFSAEGDLRFELLKVNTNPFYVGGAPVGAVSRVSADAVINVSAGGGSVPTFVSR